MAEGEEEDMEVDLEVEEEDGEGELTHDTTMKAEPSSRVASSLGSMNSFFIYRKHGGRADHMQ